MSSTICTVCSAFLNNAGSQLCGKTICINFPDWYIPEPSMYNNQPDIFVATSQKPSDNFMHTSDSGSDLGEYRSRDTVINPRKHEPIGKTIPVTNLQRSSENNSSDTELMSEEMPDDEPKATEDNFHSQHDSTSIREHNADADDEAEIRRTPKIHPALRHFSSDERRRFNRLYGVKYNKLHSRDEKQKMRKIKNIILNRIPTISQILKSSADMDHLASAVELTIALNDMRHSTIEFISARNELRRFIGL